jgi:hypothetical protein
VNSRQIPDQISFDHRDFDQGGMSFLSSEDGQTLSPVPGFLHVAMYSWL